MWENGSGVRKVGTASGGRQEGGRRFGNVAKKVYRA